MESLSLWEEKELPPQTTGDKRVGINGENRLQPTDRPAHNWYRFVLSFPPHVVRDYVQYFGIKKGQRVLDPFCGTGTTLVECKKLGLESVGVEANSMSHFASKVKVGWGPDPGALINHASQIAERALAELARDGLTDNPILGRHPA
ncbi:MAG: hypothetical protein M1379_18145 [Firmicutes bacterium]|nr:hypothetical protein [Bacillota bacterium]